MAADERYFIGPGLRSKLREVITRVDGLPQSSGGGGDIPTRLQTMPGGGGKVFRVCTFTSQWDKNTDKAVTFKYQTTTPNTVIASNLLFDIAGPATSGASTTKVCIVGKEGTGWYFVNAEKESCSGGYAARELSEDSADPDSSTGQLQESSGPQVLLNDAGCVRWFGLEEREVVTDVLWDDGLVVVKKFVWVIGDPRPPVNVKIIESTTCEESP
mgnify:CR=1 FL=1